MLAPEHCANRALPGASVLFIDARGRAVKFSNHRTLSPDDLDTIVTTYRRCMTARLHALSPMYAVPAPEGL
jgi:type I restriction-modification system DNA methylase subunit